MNYSYATQTFAGASYKLLSQVNYNDQYAAQALYTYQGANNSAAGTPLIKSCADPRFPGPLKNITYSFVAGGFYGQFYAESHTIDATHWTPVVTYNYATHTETRGDGGSGVHPYRSWTYGSTSIPGFSVPQPYLLASVTDFATNAGNSFTTNLSYDATGFVKQVRDPLLHSTSFERIASTGIPTKITHPADSHGVVSSVAYSYMDPDGYYLGSVTDERGKVTTYHRNLNNMTTSEIDYPDGGVESFDYNQFNQTWHHTMPSSTTANGAGATEVFTNDSRGMPELYPSGDGQRSEPRFPPDYLRLR